MVVVKIEDPYGKTYEYFMDNNLKKGLDERVIPRLRKKDKDWVIIIDGEEGSGKTVFGMQVAKYIDPSFNIDRICFTANQFRDAIINAKQYQAILYDEAFTGLSRRQALSEVNKILISLMMQMRQKNLAVIITLPTLFLLESYVVLWRARGLFHIYETGVKRMWVYFNKAKKKKLYMIGKKFYSYKGVRSRTRGYFFNKYTVDEQEYRKLKQNALETREVNVKKEKYLYQRDILILMLRRKGKFAQKEIAKWMNDWGVNMVRTTISEIERKYMEKVEDKPKSSGIHNI